MQILQIFYDIDTIDFMITSMPPLPKNNLRELYNIVEFSQTTFFQKHIL
jgi:hypothetical protein